MPRFFNTAGPCNPEWHYMLPPEDRLPNVRELIDSRAYFVVHAPRQVGKTTCFRELARVLTMEGRYAALHVSLEIGQALGNDVQAVEAVLLDKLQLEAAQYLPIDVRPPDHRKVPTSGSGRLEVLLSTWATVCPRPVVLFLDEIDALLDESLISVLRQLRSGYPSRPKGFPHSVALIGLRDVRDYKVRSQVREEGVTLGTSSPFNVKVKSLSIRDFSETEVLTLLGQHEGETSQVFLPGVKEEVFRLTQGQPWLVNALARELTEELGRDRAQPLTLDLLEQAKENLIERRDTHLDSLIDKLREERVKRVIEPILAGDLLFGDRLSDDKSYVMDLGLVRRGTKGELSIANPIYHEIIPRAMAYETQLGLPALPWYVLPDGCLDVAGVLTGFLEFWCEHAETMLTSQPYHEVAAQMVLLGWLQRIVNGGGFIGDNRIVRSPIFTASCGFIDREYAVGAGRIDLLIRWPYQQDGKKMIQREALELKVWKDKKPDPLGKGLTQLSAYLDRLGLDRGVLVLFDRRSNAPELPGRASLSTVTHEGRKITVLRG
ncbi:MAG: hypothetical protein A2284_01720 [Deltaproteobacteria bacterium RIFOXYA12_FULL_61_11]|nr:MAG: hypothetical protein A2284_01720 [Deltaproteobacteria bacterium RIFOXYA12_FULL_61_11]